MTKQQVAQRVMTVLGRATASNGALAGLGQAQALQPDLNRALTAWLEYSDLEPLRGVVALLQTMSSLSESDAAELLQQLEQE